jgi:hypothetical protein
MALPWLLGGIAQEQLEVDVYQVVLDWRLRLNGCDDPAYSLVALALVESTCPAAASEHVVIIPRIAHIRNVFSAISVF